MGSCSSLAAIVDAAGAVTAFERDVEGANIHNLADGLWWALVTTTTVGYGDHIPVSSQGRAMAVVLMIVGIGLFSVLTANIAAFFVETDEEDNAATDALTLDDLDARLARIEALLSAGARSNGGDKPACFPRTAPGTRRRVRSRPDPFGRHVSALVALIRPAYDAQTS